MNCKKIGEIISSQRKEKGLTQQNLADLLGVTQKSVSRWENGINLPDIDLLPKLSETLDVSLDEFFNGELKESADKENTFTDKENLIVDYVRTEEKNKNERLLKLIIYSLIFVASYWLYIKIIPLLIIFVENQLVRIFHFNLYGDMISYMTINGIIAVCLSGVLSYITSIKIGSFIINELKK